MIIVDIKYLLLANEIVFFKEKFLDDDAELYRYLKSRTSNFTLDSHLSGLILTRKRPDKTL